MSPRRLTEPPRTCEGRRREENSGGGGFFARSPSPGPPPEEHVVGEILGGEAASLREAPLPPDPSLPKSGWGSG